MWKKVFLASAITGLLTGALITLQPTTAEASRAQCREVAQARFPAGKERREFKRYCIRQWRAYRAAGRGAY
jgi:hypothetical protein